MPLVTDLLIILVVAFIMGALAYRLGQPVILGFIVAGMLVGPYTGGVTVTALIEAERLSEIGVALLLFAVGIEFSLSTLRPVYKIVLLGTPIQLGLTVVFGYGVGQLLGWERGASLWFGLLISLSSTVVTLNTLSSFRLSDTSSTRVVEGILTAQNLSVVPLSFTLRQVGSQALIAPVIAIAAIEGLFLLAVLFFLGTHLLPPLFAYVARQNSDELSLLVVLASVAVVSSGVYLYGLPFVFVAFAIGLALSESELGSRALSEILRVRDLFGLLFFVSAGMLLDLPFLVAHLNLVLLLVTLVVVGKALILAAVTRLFRYGASRPFVVALALFQTSELSLVLARLGLENAAIDGHLYSLVITTALITMLLTPFVAQAAVPFYRWARER